MKASTQKKAASPRLLTNGPHGEPTHDEIALHAYSLWEQRGRPQNHEVETWFGYDLHDGLGQRLTGLEMFSHGLAEDLKRHAPALAKQARRLNQELQETVTQARLISHSLAPVPLEGDGLMHGLSELAASTSRIPGVKCQFLCNPPVYIRDVTTATHLYRIAQEAVNNALKHGPGRLISLWRSGLTDWN